MDLEDWELLTPKSYNGLDLDLGCGEDQESMNITRKSLDMNYFTCSTQDSFQETELHQESSVVPTQDSSQEVPITRKPFSTVDATDHKNNPDPDLSDPDPELLTDSVPSPRIDIPAKITSALPQSEAKHSDSDGGLGGDDDMGSKVDEGQGGGGNLRSKKEVNWDGVDERMNLWKIGLNGIGAICSFGLAATAATICVFFLGHNNNNNNNNNIQGCRKKKQILRFQICSDDDKRMNEVVKRHATKLNEAITVMKSLPVARAQISFGGYYDGL